MPELLVAINDEIVPVRAAIADSDDNLVQTFAVKSEHHIYVAREEYGRALDMATIASHWGSGLAAELLVFYGGDDSEVEAQTRLAAYNRYDHLFPKIVNPGAVELITWFGEVGLYQGVVSSYVSENVRRDLSGAGIDVEHFDFIHGSDITPGVKPDPAAFTPAIRELDDHGILPEEALYYGDSLGDAHGATDARLQFLGVATGRVSVAAFNEAGFDAVPNLTALHERFEALN